MFAPIERKLARAGRQAALGFGAAVCLGVGLIFLTTAAWIWLVTIGDALVAAVVLGCVYCGSGLILLAAMLARKRPPPPPRPAQAPDPDKMPDLPPLVAAFFYGMQAGAKARPDRPDDHAT